jgi:hypothetical protein
MDEIRINGTYETTSVSYSFVSGLSSVDNWVQQIYGNGRSVFALIVGLRDLWTK